MFVAFMGEMVWFVVFQKFSLEVGSKFIRNKGHKRHNAPYRRLADDWSVSAAVRVEQQRYGTVSEQTRLEGENE